MALEKNVFSNGYRVCASGADAVWLLATLSGRAEPRARVTPEAHAALRHAAASGMSLAEAAKTVGLSKTTAWKVVHGVYPITRALKTTARRARSVPVGSNSLERAEVAALLESASMALSCRGAS